MTVKLNLNDIQGNVNRAYGRYSFPFARYIFFRFRKAEAGRKFVDKVRKEVTTAAWWSDGKNSSTGNETPKQKSNNPKPECTVNMAFTFPGLLALKLPVRTLSGMPDEFIEGMKARAFILGDRDQTITENEALKKNWDQDWDPIWKENRNTGSLGVGAKNVHVMVTLNAQFKSMSELDQPCEELAKKTKWLTEELVKDPDVELLSGIGKNGDQPYQDASAVYENIQGVNVPTPKEHFGFVDGIGNPVFEGQLPDDKMKEAVIGRGKLMGNGWEPLATGEFILGYPDESQELPPSALPSEFMHNGTFLAFRKLHENVGTFNEVLEKEAQNYARVMDVSHEEALETLRAKMCGRWSDGVPLSKVPTYEEWIAFGKSKDFRNEEGKIDNFDNLRKYLASPEARDFRYGDDMEGYKCPTGAHMRRVNTRDYLDPLNKSGICPETGKRHTNPKANSALNKRRRILRRGLPYGAIHADHRDDNSEQGVIMIVMAASLFRQFEFVQQQWIQYGLDFHQGNNTCPMLGNHGQHQRYTIPSDPATGKPPYVMSELKTFVECRGGDYFFVPSMTALRMMSMGIVDPT